MKFFRTSLVLLYCFIISFVLRIALSFASYFPRLKMQLMGRQSALDLARTIARERSRYAHGMIFFCSSAGEYEQAKPLITRLDQRGDIFILILFFSKSGLDFARARGERQTMALTPPTDSVWEWGSVFAAARPNATAIVRHEIWPGFLTTAAAYAPVYLINASRSLGEAQSLLKRTIKGMLLRKVSHIYTVSEEDRDFFQNEYNISPAALSVTGDTKYDRVFERSLTQKEATRALKANLDATTSRPLRMTVGSAHKPDVENILRAFLALGPAASAWQVVLVPHHATEEMVTWIQEKLSEAGISHTLLSSLSNLATTPRADSAVVIVDRMGVLAEIYAAGQAAFVGGAFHHQVHNVLEPACRGLALAWGPFYKNSQEAIQLVKFGLARVVTDAATLATWWNTLPVELRGKTTAISEAVAKLCGASDKIMTDWQASFRS